MYIDYFKKCLALVRSPTRRRRGLLQNHFLPVLLFLFIAVTFTELLHKPFSGTNPQSSHLFAKESQKDNRYISLLFAGDTHFNWGVAELQKKEGLLAPTSKIESLFRQFDFRAINLETVLTNRGYPLKEKPYVFHSLASNIKVLKHLHIDLAILGNNHSMDMGIFGLRDMFERLEQAGIGTVGAGENRAQARRPYYFQKAKQKFAFLSLTRVGHAAIFSQSRKPGVTQNLGPGQLQSIKRQAQPIVSLHWGQEYFLQPSLHQVKLAHNLIQAGASAVIGHHPHIPQAVELYKGGVIFYSLGNFLFGSTNDLQRNNIIAVLDYSKSTAKLERVRIIPISGHYLSRGHKIEVLSSQQELRTFWKEYYYIIKRHSAATARRLLIKDGIGILQLKAQ